MATIACTSGPVLAGTSKTAARCGADLVQPASKVFADFEGRGAWQEYPSAKAIPAYSTSLAQVWAGKGGNMLIAMSEASEDWTTFTDYCFDNTGHLVQLRYELRTAWGWGFREEGPFSQNRLNAQCPEFFSTNTELAIEKPEEAASIPEALRPQIFPTKAALPFFKLLSRPASKQKGTSG